MLKIGLEVYLKEANGVVPAFVSKLYGESEAVADLMVVPEDPAPMYVLKAVVLDSTGQRCRTFRFEL